MVSLKCKIFKCQKFAAIQSKFWMKIYLTSTDGIRGKLFYDRGLHVFEFKWPTDLRGTHPVVGVCTGSNPVTLFSS